MSGKITELELNDSIRNRLHEHNNKGTLEKIEESGGTLLYDGEALVSIKDETVGISPSIEDGVARVLIPGTISGKPNDGTYDYENRENYKSITVRISPNGRRLKVSDIKNLYIDIVADNHE